MQDDDARYYQDRKLAAFAMSEAACNPAVRNIHRDLASRYDALTECSAEPALDKLPLAISALFSPVTTRRIATRDTELADVRITQGYWVTIATALASLAPDRSGVEMASPTVGTPHSSRRPRR